MSNFCFPSEEEFMMRMQLTALGIVVTMALGGCANEMNPVQRGTATGAGMGAATGAVLGASTAGGGGKRTATGALLGAAAGAVIGNVWSSRMEQQKQAMQQATQGTGVQVTQTADNRLKIEIPTDISFDVNRADIKPTLEPVLDRFAETLHQNPVTEVTIVGFTDNTGSDAINNPLSVNRAASTRDYLASRGVSANRIRIDGRGSRDPIASNATESGRARNRRVEIYVAEEQAMAAPAPQSSGSSAPPPAPSGPGY
jgi:outer membrane protein OmpA-like peptidoglycan-associated protein